MWGGGNLGALGICGEAHAPPPPPPPPTISTCTPLLGATSTMYYELAPLAYCMGYLDSAHLNDSKPLHYINKKSYKHFNVYKMKSFAWSKLSMLTNCFINYFKIKVCFNYILYQMKNEKYKQDKSKIANFKILWFKKEQNVYIYTSISWAVQVLIQLKAHIMIM